jgi:hypothetical protein
MQWQLPWNKLWKCEVLGLDESFQGTFFCHVFSKACKYAINNKKACKNLKIYFHQIMPSQICKNV